MKEFTNNNITYILGENAQDNWNILDNSNQNDIWFHPHKSYNGYNNNFSKDMILRCIENYTDIGEIVLDIFMGVGTTAISCIESNRDYLGVEINTEVYENAISRLSVL